MNERQMQFRVGVVMFATLIIAALLATLNGPVLTEWLPWGRSTYQIAIRLPQAPGVGPNTPVRKNGLLIGRVATIDDLDNGVVLHVNIEEGRRLLTSHVPHVRTSVLGDAAIDFVTTPIDAPPQQLQGGAVISGVVDPNPFDSIAQLGNLQDDIQETMHALTRAGNEVASLANRVDEAFGSDTEEGRVKRLLDATERAMNEVGNAAAAFNDILSASVLDEPVSRSGTPGRPAAALANFQQQEVVVRVPTTRDRLRQALNELPTAIHEMRTTMEQFRTVLESANKNFKNLEGFTEPLGRSGEQVARSIVEAVDGLDKLVEEFTVLTQALNSREGTFGQLIHNPQTYENLNRLLFNANQVVCQVNDLTLRLRPVLDDVRVFTDKVAREPGRVIIGGLNPSPIK